MRYCWNWSISRYHQVDLHQEIKLCNAKPLQKNCSEISYIKQERRSDTYFIADSLSANFFSKSYPHFLTWSSLFQFIIQSKTKSSTCYGSRITTELKWRSEMDCVMIYNEKKKEKKKDAVPKRIARRTRKGSSRNVAFAGNGVTILPDLRSSMPVILSVPCYIILNITGNE